ncbi:hypothetical protein [Oceaniglobus trochenteri]|uniref:hypothetical protein n=1 Tax=Oceaniglobus trochenteri TaxID=2763260 RepID=UPI001CFF6BB4|nr:hypothetical protein [Oceaniglobus trochenteri]
MLILTATICLLSDPVTVDCRTEAMRIETDPRECLALVAPVEAMLVEQAGDLPVIYVKAACKLGVLS